MRNKLIPVLIALVSLVFPITACTGSTGTSDQPTAAHNLKSIQISGNAQVQFLVGLSRQFNAIGTFDDGSTADITSKVTWTSADSEIATMSATGLAKGLNPGTTKITAAQSGISSQPVDVQITGFPMLDLSISTSTGRDDKLPEMIPLQSLQLQGLIMSPDGRYSYVAPDKWTSSDPSVAMVSPTGLLTALKAGSVTITGSYQGYKSRPYPLTVVAFSSIFITPNSPANLQIGSTAKLTATVTYPDGKTEDVTAKVGWVSSVMQVGTFTSPGVILAQSPGYTSIQVSFEGINSDPVILWVVN